MKKRRKTKSRWFLFTFFSSQIFCISIASGATIHVPWDQPTIQAGIDAASEGDVVLVDDGIYDGVGNKNIDFGGKAIVLRSENGPGNTIIDCQANGRGFYFHNGETSSTAIDGFTIRNGGNVDKGGGIYCSSYASPTIVNCVIMNNTANGASSTYGGGLYCMDASPTISNSMFIANWASYYGGAIYCLRSSPVITNCHIRGNRCDTYAGGIACNFSSSPSIINCTISGNVAIQGGGVHCYASSYPTISNCILWNNSATAGKEISVSGDSFPTIVKYSDVEGWSPYTAYTWWGPGNIDEDPVFVMPGFWNASEWVDGNYHLTSASPCIDAGVDSRIYTDIDGEDRPYDVTYIDNNGPHPEIDMGADEYVPSCTCTVPLDYPTIQQAIDASQNTDTICVRDGTYSGTGNKNLDFKGKSISLRSEHGPESSIIDCAGGGRGFHFHSGEVPSAIVDGFTIKNGAVSDFGGGIYCTTSSSPSIVNCKLENNVAVDGGGIHCRIGSSPRIIGCTIRQNEASGEGADGGGIHCNGSSPIIKNCSIKFNDSTYHGAGIYCYNSSPSIIGSYIGMNYAQGTGGGVYCSYSHPAISRCEIRGNHAIRNGGGVWCNNSAPIITNCAIHENMADDIIGVYTNFGGGIYLDDHSDAELYFCTIKDNRADTGGAIFCDRNSRPHVSGSILWGDQASSGPELALRNYSYVSMGESTVAGGQAMASVDASSTLLWLSGNSEQDPLFSMDMYRLEANSPCIDAVNWGWEIYTDIDDDHRPSGAAYDKGCDEYVSNHCPVLSMGFVEPEDGDTTTLFGYAVHYSDPDGNPPSAKWVMIDGWGFEMTLLSGTPEQGVYYYETTLEGGNHTYYYSFSDGQGCSVRLPESGTYSGPSVHACASLSNGEVSPGSGNTTTNFTFSVDYYNANGNAPAISRIVIDEYLAYEMTLVNGTPDHGIYQYATTLGYGNHLFYFLFEDVQGCSTRLPSGWQLTGPQVTAASYYVPDDFPTIQAALSAAVENDVVIVREGIYTGASNKNLDFGGKNIVLRSEKGPKQTVIDCQGDGRGFYFHNRETSTCVVDGFTIRNGSIQEGSTPLMGGGILCWYASPRITNCIISGNVSARHGGGICSYYASPIISNCMITGNAVGSPYYGGGICSVWSGSPIVTNCTFSGNTATKGGGIASFFLDSNLTILNSILWENSASDGKEIAVIGNASATVENSDIEGGETAVFTDPEVTLSWGTHNLDTDPLFLNPGTWQSNDWVDGDYHLTGGSPCIDSGSNTASEIPETDFEGDSRFFDGDQDGTATVDMGADEYVGAVGDVDHDGDVDGFDLATLASGQLDAAAVEAFAMGFGKIGG